MMTNNDRLPYVFEACANNACSDPAVSARADFFAGASVPNPYARVYVVSQRYDNFASPECALRNGTLFNDLNMPYVRSMCAKCGR